MSSKNSSQSSNKKQQNQTNYQLLNIKEHPYLKTDSRYKQALSLLLLSQSPQQFQEKADALTIKLLQTNVFKQIYYHLNSQTKKVNFYTIKYQFNPKLSLNSHLINCFATNYNFFNTLGRVQTIIQHSFLKKHKKAKVNFFKNYSSGILNLGYQYRHKKPITDYYCSNNHNFSIGYSTNFIQAYLQSSSRTPSLNSFPLQKQLQNPNLLKKSDLWTIGLKSQWNHPNKSYGWRSSIKLGFDKNNNSSHLKFFNNFYITYFQNRHFKLFHEVQMSSIKGKNVLPCDLIHPKSTKWMGQRSTSYIRNKLSVLLWSFPFLSTFKMVPHQYLQFIVYNTNKNSYNWQIQSGLGINYLGAMKPMYLQIPILQMKKEPGIRIKFTF